MIYIIYTRSVSELRKLERKRRAGEDSDYIYYYYNLRVHAYIIISEKKEE